MSELKHCSARNGKIEFFRFVFCFIIMIMHSSTFVPSGVTNFFKNRGALGVEFFFIVSGYLMAVSVSKSPPSGGSQNIGIETIMFIGKKIRALMPNFLVAWLISFFVTLLRYKDLSALFVMKKFLDCFFEPLLLSMAGFGQGNFNGVDWYISAMLLSMMILYPLCRKYFLFFTHVISPLISIFILGYFSYNYQSITEVTAYIGLGFKGLFRAFAMISLGVSCYPIITFLKDLSLTRFAKKLVSLSEFLCYSMIVFYMATAKTAKYDFIVIFTIMIGVCLSFTHQGVYAHKFDHPICYFLGEFSLSLYLGHVFWGRLIGSWYPNGNYLHMLVLYVCLAFGTAIFIHIISKNLRKRSALINSSLKKALLN